VVKRPRKPAAPPEARARYRALAAVALTLGCAAALLFGLSRIGDEARRGIGPRDRYAIPVSDVRCPAPPGLSREQFLSEVRYAGDTGPTVQLLDPDLRAKLTKAFKAHPWVLSADRVTAEPPGTVLVELTFRTPALAVRVGNDVRAADTLGVVLPTGAPVAGLPQLVGEAAPPGAAGAPWPDEAVRRAAALAAEYKPLEIERTPQGFQLTLPDGKRLSVSR
jgi:hypothetical protein